MASINQACKVLKQFNMHQRFLFIYLLIWLLFYSVLKDVSLILQTQAIWLDGFVPSRSETQDHPHIAVRSSLVWPESKTAWEVQSLSHFTLKYPCDFDKWDQIIYMSRSILIEGQWRVIIQIYEDFLFKSFKNYLKFNIAQSDILATHLKMPEQHPCQGIPKGWRT